MQALWAWKLLSNNMLIALHSQGQSAALEGCPGNNCVPVRDGGLTAGDSSTATTVGGLCQDCLQVPLSATKADRPAPAA